MIDLLENSRLRIQQRLDQMKTAEERNRLGQFATPTQLALELLECAKAVVPPRMPIRFLDPALGTGSFWSALLRVFPNHRIKSGLGYALDFHFGRHAKELWESSGLDVQIADFTRATPPEPDERPNLIVCNPPYVRHHHLHAEEKMRLIRRSNASAGVLLSGLSGLYVHFMCIAHEWMATSGYGFWLIPSEFMDVNYGRELKRYLLDRVSLLRIHRFDPCDLQFSDALVSSAVVIIRNRPPDRDHQVEFTYGGSLVAPTMRRHVLAQHLRSEAKWTRFPSAEGRVGQPTRLRLGDLFAIKRGLATGANDFFIMTREQAAARGIPDEFLTPILPSPRYLHGSDIDADDDGCPKVERQMFLFSSRLPEDTIRAKYPTVWRYLQDGVRLGIHERYLCRHRTPWYSQEDREPSPLLCTYMSRSRNGRLFRFFRNRSRATACNVFLLFYPKPRLHQIIQTHPDFYDKVCQALNEIPADMLIREGRVYGGGLHKLEPRELANLPISLLNGAVAGIITESPSALAEAH